MDNLSGAMGRTERRREEEAMEEREGEGGLEKKRRENDGTFSCSVISSCVVGGSSVLFKVCWIPEIRGKDEEVGKFF